MTLCFILICSLLFTYEVSAEVPIKVFLDEKQLVLENDPLLKNNTTFVEFRPICEGLGLDVDWNQQTKTVKCQNHLTTLYLTIGQGTAYVNGNATSLSTPPFVVNGRTLVPLRFLGEASGGYVSWNGQTRTIEIFSFEYLEAKKQDLDTYTIFDISIGDTENGLIAKLGKPDRQLPSVTGYTLYVYHSDYLNYVQFGVASGKVVSIFSGSKNWQSSKGIKVGLSKKEVASIYSGIQTHFNDYQYSYRETMNLGKTTADIYYDFYTKKVASVYLKANSYTPEGEKWTSKMMESLEIQVFDMANMARAHHGLNPLDWDENARLAAKGHSEDMAKRNYYSHNSPDGITPWDRLRSYGISFRGAGENIYMSPRSAMDAHQGWMNSEGHRRNILGAFERVGIGVATSSSGESYFTQKFFNPY